MTRNTAIGIGVALGAAVVLVLLVRGKEAQVPSRARPIATAPEITAPEPPSIQAPRPEPVTPQPPSPPSSTGDGSLMNDLRVLVDTDPVRAYALAHEGQKRFPDSPYAAERAALAVKSLARQGKLSEARAEAEVMVNQYPDSPWALEVEKHTGAHPHRTR